jgi:ribosome recycling factor
MSSDFNETNYAVKMDKTIQSFKKDLSSLRTGRANAAMLDMIKVDVYGQLMPVNQMATISVPESRLITVQVWDQANIKAMDSAIQKSDLGINPQIDGSVLRLRIPDLTEERRNDLIKILKSIGDKKISEDDNSIFEKNVQKLTDEHIANIEKILSEKEKEILQV